ncbi:MAG: hypothetical protein HHJ13_04335 [Phycicoccus sp.]|nr:hypothetical protein [Phycicoccus sp.]
MAEPGRRQRRTQARLARELAVIGFALPGSLVWRSTACGKTGCRCQGDPPDLHGPYLTWTRAAAGKTITRRITPEQQQRYQDWFDNARRLHQLVTELQALSLQAFDEAEDSPRRR